MFLFPSTIVPLYYDFAAKRQWTPGLKRQSLSGGMYWSIITLIYVTNLLDIESMLSWFLPQYQSMSRGKGSEQHCPCNCTTWKQRLSTWELDLGRSGRCEAGNPFRAALCFLRFVTIGWSESGHYWRGLNWSREAKMAEIHLSLLQVSPAKCSGKAERTCLKARAWMVSNAFEWDEHGDDAKSHNGCLTLHGLVSRPPLYFWVVSQGKEIASTSCAWELCV